MLIVERATFATQGPAQVNFFSKHFLLTCYLSNLVMRVSSLVGAVPGCPE